MIERTIENIGQWPSAAVFALGATAAMFTALCIASFALWLWERRG